MSSILDINAGFTCFSDTDIASCQSILTLFDPAAYFRPFKTQGLQICPQAFSWTPGGSDLLKKGLTIKSSQYMTQLDP